MKTTEERLMASSMGRIAPPVHEALDLLEDEVAELCRVINDLRAGRVAAEERAAAYHEMVEDAASELSRLAARLSDRLEWSETVK